MSGWANGVQAKIKQTVPHAIYVHCYAHRLNLVLVDSLKNISDVSELFDCIQNLYVFICNSNTRHELFVKAQKELDQQVLQLERTVETRWFYWYQSIQKVKLRYEALLSVLTVCTQNSTDKAYSEAFGIKNKLENFKIILTMFVVEKILSITNPLSVQLQTKDQSIVSAIGLIKSTQNSLQSIRNEAEYNKIYENA
jgi:hypothetical protein